MRPPARRGGGLAGAALLTAARSCAAAGRCTDWTLTDRGVTQGIPVSWCTFNCYTPGTNQVAPACAPSTSSAHKICCCGDQGSCDPQKCGQWTVTLRGVTQGIKQSYCDATCYAPGTTLLSMHCNPASTPAHQICCCDDDKAAMGNTCGKQCTDWTANALAPHAPATDAWCNANCYVPGTMTLNNACDESKTGDGRTCCCNDPASPQSCPETPLPSPPPPSPPPPSPPPPSPPPPSPPSPSPPPPSPPPPSPPPPPTPSPTPSPTPTPETLAPGGGGTDDSDATWQVAVGGDPFATYGGKSTQFYLPVLGVLTPLISCGGVTVDGAAVGSGAAGDAQQWFRAFAVRAGDEELLRVAARGGGAPAAAAAAAEGDAGDVAVVVDHPARLPAAGEEELASLDVAVGGRAVARTGRVAAGPLTADVRRDAPQRGGAGWAESVDAAAGGVRVEFAAAAALGPRGGPAHVDARFRGLNASACSGVLPEIWGVAPLSAATAAMLVPPHGGGAAR